MNLFTCYSFCDGEYGIRYKNAKLLTLYSSGNDIQELLKMNQTQYEQLFKEYNTEGTDTFFKKQEDCQRLCDYLNEVYGPIIKLVGGYAND